MKPEHCPVCGPGLQGKASTELLMLHQLSGTDTSQSQTLLHLLLLCLGKG